jgi:hypothetical protein
VPCFNGNGQGSCCLVSSQQFCCKSAISTTCCNPGSTCCIGFQGVLTCCPPNSVCCNAGTAANVGPGCCPTSAPICVYDDGGFSACTN